MHLRFLPGLLAIASLVAVASDNDWKTKPFPNWNQPSVLRLVTDSPWAHPRRVKLVWTKQQDRPFRVEEVPGTRGPGAQNTGMSPIGGIGVPRRTLPDSADILVRWASSLPVRHAKALYKQRDQGVDPAKVSSLIEAPPTDYALEFFGIPAEIAHQGPGMIENLAMQSATLRTPAGRVIKATKAEAKVTGLSLTLVVHFPNNEPLTVADEEVECYVDLQIFEVRERFRLAPMMYLKHLEL